MELVKDKSIIRLLARLKLRLGPNAFEVVDDWDADLFAIGIARPDKPDVLVYICTFGRPPDEYFVSLELPPEQPSDLPYRPAGNFEVRGFEELVAIIRKHFAEADPSSNRKSRA